MLTQILSDYRNHSLQTLVAVVAYLFTASAGFAEDSFPTPINTEKSTTHAMSPEEVCKTVSLPAGFKLTAFAAEPNVQNPIAITTDDRGRLWVAENYTWAGADAGNFDLGLKDRVIILEDTNADGKSDKRKVFFNQAERLTSVEVGMGGVWLLCPPQLLFVPDKDGDDVPDGPPQVVLDGFDIKTSTHTVANGLKWGPDGWLYGRQGILGTSHIGIPGADDAHRVTMNTGVWRYHPVSHVVEAAMHGMTNPWGFDYDPYGEIFVTNTVIGHLWHVIPGARTERMSGTDFNPYAYQLIQQVADHVHWASGEVWTDVRREVTDRTSAAGGGHAHTGLMIYQGDNWPEEYRGRAFTLNIHGRRLNCDLLKRKPVGYVATHGKDMCFVTDPWFRGMDVISGADGGAFIADWSDTGECHEMGGVHRTSGRIYKLTYGSSTSAQPIDLAKATDEQLAKLQSANNDWKSRRARLVLEQRAASGSLNRPKCREILLEIFKGNSDPVVRLRAAWTLYLTGCVDEHWLVAQLAHPDEHIRVWAVRFLSDKYGVHDVHEWSPVAEKLAALTKDDPSGLVLLYLASALQKLPLELRWKVAEGIACRPEKPFAEDRTLSVMLWLGLEPMIAKQPADAIALMQRTTFQLIRENIAHRLAADIDRDDDPVSTILEVAANNRKLRSDILRGVAAAVNGRKNIPVPASWKSVRSKLADAADTELTDSLNTIGIAFNDDETIAALRRTVGDARIRAHKLLVAAHPSDLSGLLRALIKNPALSLEAVRGLAAYDDREAPAAILNSFQSFTPDQKIAAINTLASRPNYAKALVGALESKRVKPTDISAVQARQLIALRDNALNERLRAIWGDIRQTTGEKRETMDHLRAILIPALAKADLQNGKAIFTKTCATCHVLFGEGKRIGPELTGSNRKNLDYLVENIVDPSAVVGAEFRTKVVQLNDGRVLNGIIREQNDNTITLETAESQQVIDRKSIDDLSVSDKSLMPDGLLQPLTDVQVRDLIGYLMSN